jgi:hypothetical protein
MDIFPSMVSGMLDSRRMVQKAVVDFEGVRGHKPMNAGGFSRK